MQILEQLAHPAFHPSKADRRLMAYIREHAQDVPRATIRQLADAAETAESTVTRFAKKMGFAGLQAFKVALAEEVTARSNRYIIHHSITCDEPALVTGRKLLDMNVAALERTLERLPEGRIEACTSLLLEGRRLRFVGLGNSGFTARDTAYRFYRIGLDSMGTDNSHEMYIMAALARAGDVFVAISHSGRSPEVLAAMCAAREAGARIIVVTSDVVAPMMDAADLSLVYDAKESLLETGSIAVKMAQSFLLDLLYTQVVKELGDRAIESKQKTAQVFRGVEPAGEL
ncbi:MAG: MurR/RpiR family transcriptional regulator [Selenomonadaceae bacterium]|nr:MurR/RpiR family transcriptional regulator [Selenomonadaceae bacterium]